MGINNRAAKYLEELQLPTQGELITELVDRDSVHKLHCKKWPAIVSMSCVKEARDIWMRQIRKNLPFLLKQLAPQSIARRDWL